MLFGVQGTIFFSLNIRFFFLDSCFFFFFFFLLWCCSKETARREGVSREYAPLNQMVFTLFQMLFRRFRPFLQLLSFVCALPLLSRYKNTHKHTDITVPLTIYKFLWCKNLSFVCLLYDI